MIQTRVAGIELNSYVLNASGPRCSTFEELEALANSDSPAITMKSCTVEPRTGNPEPRYSRLPLGSIQSIGLANLGYRKYVKLSSLLKKHKKPIIASIAGLCFNDYITMVRAFQKSCADLIEVNLSCPNIEGKPLAYDIRKTKKLLFRLSEFDKKPIGLKLPAYYSLAHQEYMARLIKRYSVSFITCINSLGNALVIDPVKETPAIKPRKGIGGLSGQYIKPIALANVRGFYELLEDRVSIIGVGGITTGMDCFEFLLAGADAVAVATTFEKEGPFCFTRINKELEGILREKKYSSVSEAKGKLKYL